MQLIWFISVNVQRSPALAFKISRHLFDTCLPNSAFSCNIFILGEKKEDEYFMRIWYFGIVAAASVRHLRAINFNLGNLDED